MKLDNKGWGLQDLVIGIGILFFCLLLIVSLINTNLKKLNNSLDNTPNHSDEEKEEINYSSYKQIENAMKEAAKKYNEAVYGAELQEGDNITVTIKSLVRDNYIKQITDIKDDNIICSGYVTFIKENNRVTYKPYLKCDKKYTTKGYLERLDG